MAEHMPGAWKVGYHAMDVLAPSKMGGMHKVCDIRGWGYLTGKGSGALGLEHEEAVAIQKANAALISAAPDMLVALREAESQITYLHEKSAATGSGEAALAKIRQALAKATNPEHAPA